MYNGVRLPLYAGLPLYLPCPCTYYFCFLNICNSGLLSYLVKDICTALVAGRCPPPPLDINTTTPVINYNSLSHPAEAWLYL